MRQVRLAMPGLYNDREVLFLRWDVSFDLQRAKLPKRLLRRRHMRFRVAVVSKLE